MSYKKMIYQDDMMLIMADDNNTKYHELEIESQLDGEIESVTVNKVTGKINIRFREDLRKKEFDEQGDYIKPKQKDKDFSIEVIKETVEEKIKSLEMITDFSTLKKGDKIFNKKSLSVDFIDTFDHIKKDEDGKLIVYYYNHRGEYHWWAAEGCWYYID